MKFEDLQFGKWFVVHGGTDLYMKHPLIEDKWGNCFIAVNKNGHLLMLDDGSASAIIQSQWTALTIVSDGSAWYII